MTTSFNRTRCTSTRSRQGTGIVAALLVSALIAMGCSVNFDIGTEEIQGSGTPETRTYDLADFDHIEVSSAFRLTASIAPGGPYTVAVTADDNLFDRINVAVKDSTLTIGMEDGISISTQSGSEAVVTLPELVGIQLSGASRGFVESNGTAVDDIELSGASRLEIIDMDATDLSVDVSGASKLELEGAGARSISLDVSGASDANLDRLPIGTASVDVSGASEARFGDVAAITGDVSGVSTLRVPDTADVDVDASDSSSVQQR